jgi:hypothetical protein
MEKHLKSHQYYSDLYDRGTVEDCRRIERICDKPTPLPEDSKLSEKEARGVEAWAKKLYLRGTMGERYLKKSETIREWTDRDKKRDELLENAQPPEDIRCLTCRNRLSVTFKDLQSDEKKGDRVFFMFDCPNKCLPRRAFFSDGEEWRVKPTLCLHCSTELDKKMDDDGKKLVTTLTCPKCGYVEKEEYEWHSKKDDDFDPDFAKDRDRFCMTAEEGAEYSDEKYRMEQLARLGKEFEEEQKRRDEKLKENPKGFHLDGVGYGCFICGDHTKEGDNWYDEYGIKCLVCQKAIDNGEIPASLAKEKDSWYTRYDFEHYFNVTSPALRKWVKEGIVKSRTVSQYGKGVHTELFLIEDNKDFLPPKDMLKSQSVKTRGKDGKDYYHMEDWYKFVDPFEHLKGYRIMNHLRVVPPEEMKAREEEQKKKDEARRLRREQMKANRPKRKKRSTPSEPQKDQTS